MGWLVAYLREANEADFGGEGWLGTRGPYFSAFLKKLFCPPSAGDPFPGADGGGMKKVML